MRMSTRACASTLQLVLHHSLHVTVVRAQTIIVNVQKLNVHFLNNRESKMMIRVDPSKYEYIQVYTAVPYLRYIRDDRMHAAEFES